MSQSLIVTSQIRIDAPVSKVWEVLVAPKYIRQWDDLPQDFDDYYLDTGRVISWPGFSKMTVKVCEPYEKLVLDLYSEKWEQPPAAYDIAYTYDLISNEGVTTLTLQIGDFGILPDGENYYQASEEFASIALEKIKSLAENRV
jgi:uncharacterized protein YndB with AHSA1/START domain